MISTLEPSASQNAFSLSTAAASVPGSGVRMHPAAVEQLGKAGLGPDCSVPAIGWPGTKCTPSGTCGAMSRTTAAFTEPTSVRMAPGRRCGAISAASGPQAPTGTQRMTRSAPCTASAARVVTLVDEAELQRRLQRRLGARAADDLLGEPLAPHGVADRRADQADADQRHALEHRLAHARLPPDEIGERRDDRAVVGLGADGHAQAVGKAVAGDLAHDDAARLEELVGRRRRRCASPLGKCTRMKLATLGVTVRPSLLDLRRQPRQPLLVVGDRGFLVRLVGDRRGARRHRRRPTR